MLKAYPMEIADFRIDRRKKHNLADIMMVVLVGMLCGHKSIEEIHFHAELSEEDLRKYPKFLDLRGVIVTVDAMGCRKKLAKKITEKKSDCPFSLKENHEKMHADAKNFFGHEPDEEYRRRYGIRGLPCGMEKNPSRTEKRECRTCTNLEWLEGKAGWPNLNAVGMARSYRRTASGESIDTRHFMIALTDVRLAMMSPRSNKNSSRRSERKFR